MALTINSNIASLNAANGINKAREDKDGISERLSSGKRLTKASDDPASLAIALQLASGAELNGVASRNISDGISTLSVADGGLSQASEITTRLAELSQQAANGTVNDEQRAALNEEFQQLSAELDRISTTTEFNGQQLLSGGDPITIQAGTDGGGNSQINVSTPNVSAASLGLPTSIAPQPDAQTAVDSTQTAVDQLAQARAEIGAQEARLVAAQENARTERLGQQEAAARLIDADIAAESSRLASANVREQASVAVQAQANVQPAVALDLLKG